MVEVYLLYDYDPRIKFSPEALQLANSLGKTVEGKVLVGGSPPTEPLDQTACVESRIKELREHTRAEIWCFPGDETQVTPNADGMLVPCVYNALDRDLFDLRQIAFEAKFGAGLRAKWGEDKIEYSFYPILDTGASAFKGRCREVTHEEVVNAMKFWYHGGYTSFDRFYLEGGSGQKMAPLELIGNCYNVFARTNPNIFIYGGGMRSVEQIRPVREIGVRNFVFGNILQYRPDEMRVILEEVLT